MDKRGSENQGVDTGRAKRRIKKKENNCTVTTQK